METLVVILAALLGSGNDNLKACSCTLNQNSIVTDTSRFQVKGISSKKCMLEFNLLVGIEPENDSDFLNKTYEVTLYSTTRGKLSEHSLKGFTGSLVGSHQLTMHERIVTKKREEIWLEVRSSGKYLVTMKKDF